MSIPATQAKVNPVGFKQKLLKNIFVAGGYNYLSQILVFLSSMVTSRLLSPESFGMVGLITAFTGFILVFSDGGLSYALIRSEYGRPFHRVVTNLSWILGLTLFGITAAIAWPIAKFYNNPQLFAPTIVLGITFLLRSISLTPGAVLAKELNFNYIGKVTLISNVSGALMTIILAFLDFGFWSLVFPQIVIAGVMAWMYERKVKLGFHIYSAKRVRFAFKYTSSLLGSILGFNAINYWARNTDNLVVGKVYGPSDLGIYNRAYSLMTLPVVIISGVFSNVLFPSLKDLKANNGDTESTYYFVLKLISFITLPLVIAFVLFPQPIILFLWGNDWIKVAELLPYFGLLILAQNLLSTIGPVLVLEGAEKKFFVMGCVNAVFLVGAILYGATISITAIAQFYTLSYLLLAIPFTIVYAYIGTMKYHVKNTLIFWIPRILISLFVWIAIYFNSMMYQVIGLAVLVAYLLFEGRNELGKAKALIQNRRIGKSKK
ncbi:MAG: hypothetical protein EOO02_04305 [Chitinophagaceae bacterium]|nr:MAG: hypothetical protein EOO02_04305 [Chitinophagaceae bacterium]